MASPKHPPTPFLESLSLGAVGAAKGSASKASIALIAETYSHGSWRRPRGAEEVAPTCSGSSWLSSMPTTRMRMTETNSYRMTRTDHDRSGPMSFANFADEMCEIPHASSAPSSSNDTLLRESSISKGKAKG